MSSYNCGTLFRADPIRQITPIIGVFAVFLPKDYGLKKFHPFLLSVVSGLLLFAAWPVSPLTFLIFFAFIPLLWLERQGGKRFFGWVYIAMLTWNVAAT